MAVEIWKYPLEVTDVQDIEMPIGAEVLCVQTQGQGGRPCLWARVVTDNDIAIRRVYTVGTGHDAAHTETLDYAGTYQLHGGSLVFHVFVD